MDWRQIQFYIYIPPEDEEIAVRETGWIAPLKIVRGIPLSILKNGINTYEMVRPTRIDEDIYSYQLTSGYCLLSYVHLTTNCAHGASIETILKWVQEFEQYPDHFREC